MICRHRTSVLLAIVMSVLCPAASGQRPVSTDAISRSRPNCTDCDRRARMLNQRKQNRLEQIRLEILAKLDKVDKPMGNVSKIPEELIKDFDHHRNPAVGPGRGLQADGRYNADISTIYSIPQKGMYEMYIALVSTMS